MSWTYRVIRDKDGGHRIAEVYGPPGPDRMWTAAPMAAYGDTLDELRTDMTRMMEAFAHPVLDETELEAKAAAAE